MDWIDVFAFAVSGGLGAAIARLIAGGKKDRRPLLIGITLVAMFAIHAVAARVVLPGIYQWEADRELRKIALYSEIAENDPQTYDKIRVILLAGMKAGGSSKEAAETQGSAIIANTLPKYIATASDDSVNAFASIVLEEAEDLNRANPDACYQYLFPGKSGSPALLASLVDNAKKEKNLRAMGDIVHSSTHNPQSPPDPKESAALLNSINTPLIKKYGSDLDLVRGTAKDTAERKKVCDITADFYRSILNMPPKKSSELLRYILSPR
jgi:hypothetical protein